MTAQSERTSSGSAILGTTVILTPSELHTPTQRVALRAVTHVGLIDRPARTPTRRILQLGALCSGLVLALVSFALQNDPTLAGVLVLLPLLASVLLSDRVERRFPTPGRYGIEVAATTGVVRIDGVASEARAHELHEQVAAAVRAAQGLNP